MSNETTDLSPIDYSPNMDLVDQADLDGIHYERDKNYLKDRTNLELLPRLIAQDKETAVAFIFELLDKINKAGVERAREYEHQRHGYPGYTLSCIDPVFWNDEQLEGGELKDCDKRMELADIEISYVEGAGTIEIRFKIDLNSESYNKNYYYVSWNPNGKPSYIPVDSYQVTGYPEEFEYKRPKGILEYNGDYLFEGLMKVDAVIEEFKKMGFVITPTDVRNGDTKYRETSTDIFKSKFEKVDKELAGDGHFALAVSVDQYLQFRKKLVDGKKALQEGRDQTSDEAAEAITNLFLQT